MPKMAKNHQIEGSNSEINGSSGGLFGEGGLLNIFSSRVRAYSRGGAFLRGGAIRGFTVLTIFLNPLPIVTANDSEGP